MTAPISASSHASPRQPTPVARVAVVATLLGLGPDGRRVDAGVVTVVAVAVVRLGRRLGLRGRSGSRRLGLGRSSGLVTPGAEGDVRPLPRDVVEPLQLVGGLLLEATSHDGDSLEVGLLLPVDLVDLFERLRRLRLDLLSVLEETAAKGVDVLQYSCLYLSVGESGVCQDSGTRCQTPERGGKTAAILDIVTILPPLTNHR